MSDTQKKKGRPPLSPEERDARRIAQNKMAMERHKKNGYAAQKKYRAAHPEKYRQNYEPKVRIPLEFKATIDDLTQRTGLSISQLFISSVEEKYDVVLHRQIDKRN